MPVKTPCCKLFIFIKTQNPPFLSHHHQDHIFLSRRYDPQLREFPPITAVHALAECRHRLISTPCLSLRVRDHFLLALSALELFGDTLLDLGDHCLVQVFRLDAGFFLTALVRLHFFVRHDDEFLRRNVACQYGFAQSGVGFRFEVLEEGAHFLLVGVVGGAEVGVGGGFDCFCDGQDGLGNCT